MIRFNDTNIFTGYIKQLLKSFNLPKYKVYTKEQEEYHNNYIKHSKEITSIKKSLAVVEEELATAAGESKEILLREKEDLVHQLANIGVSTDNTPEKDVLVSMYRNEPKSYGQSATKYPFHMRYIPYIRHGEVQLYAPTTKETVIDSEDGGRTVTTTITYSEDDWKPFHGAFIDTHGKIHKDTDELFLSKGYVYNRRLRNGTKNLVIDNNTYDTYTHEYLGDFLRFHRDYYGIDLMPLYNCFSNTTCPHLNVTFKVNDSYSADFKSSDDKYKIYMIPIKFFQKYTIAIDCNEAVELCCGLYGQYAYGNSYDEILQNTYVCYNNMRFDKPELFDITDKLKPYLDPGHVLEVAQHEDDLKMFIKIPATNKSSIVILEGDYTEYQNPLWNGSFNYEGIKINDTTITSNDLNLDATTLSANMHLNALSVNNDTLNLTQMNIDGYDRQVAANTGARVGDTLLIDNAIVYNGDPILYNYNVDNTLTVNKTIINFENEDDVPKKLITPLHLLKLNTGESYPFANRLLEYLIGNAITPIDSIADNIERAKTAVKKKLKSASWLNVNGIWDDKLRVQFYNYIINLPNNFNINHDVLGYVDKDVEAYYSYINKILRYKNGYKLDKEEKEIRTISSTNIYGDDEWED